MLIFKLILCNHVLDIPCLFIDLISVVWYLFEPCRKMVTETRSVMGGQNLSQGRGNNISPRVSNHENPVQEENREEAQGEHHVDFEEASLQ